MPAETKGFLSRWSQRKLSEAEAEPESEIEPSGEESIDLCITQASSDNENSIATLLTSTAEASVKKAALRQLFLNGDFSEIDMLDDYNQDFNQVSNLSTEVVAKLRDWMNEENEETNDENIADAENAAEGDEIIVENAQQLTETKNTT
ncbi:DUF3306 domain-containing protein [Vibrio aestuarianus]|uniref:DUF3306 domain-containing protein n=1 Tax=Vibrio aestuarianus TaxID=28171 RepID=A0ABM9FQ43_9VIBR|nr:DUF3306 domain-containing protein [Vibrio aestuarianus]MDE1212540.1 DUF3306 domain-containing protein [Vibrio aestuarianus]MDE1216897.1 DUF3306 domain-containing protein [Vibrio aestuarianus]MDE1228396.1 DUF3306 domain-containing protein [Vibrio aestuarianus]MDE1256636.1 DUF3306 domain-containing protein [Vibrio aestuarianus]MDE1259714.1 DUF3306 domain-containing protein [Vibrio aestuarianus]